MRYVEPTYRDLSVNVFVPHGALAIIASTSRDEADTVAKSQRKHRAMYRVCVESVTSLCKRTNVTAVCVTAYVINVKHSMSLCTNLSVHTQ